MAGARLLIAMMKSHNAVTFLLNISYFLSVTSSVLSMAISSKTRSLPAWHSFGISGIEVTYFYIVEGTNTTEISYTTHSEGGLPIPMITICPTRNPFLASRLKGRALPMSSRYALSECAPWLNTKDRCYKKIGTARNIITTFLSFLASLWIYSR